MTNDKDQQTEELWKMVQVFSQHADEMKKLLETERAKNKALNAENSGWLSNAWDEHHGPAGHV